MITAFEVGVLVKFANVKIGDVLTREIANIIRVDVKVTGVTDQHVICGEWIFDKETGMEEDPEIGWGKAFGITGSLLMTE